MTQKYSGILTIRKWKEEGIQNEMARLRNVLSHDEKRLSDLQGNVACHENHVDEIMREGECTSAYELAIYSSYVSHLSGEVRRQETVVKRRSNEVDRKRDELGEAAKDRKIVETLRDKATAEHLREVGRKEQREIDDAVSVRCAKRS
ncbi:MAG: flagellar export protein FliJ [Nitrospirae bacterium]|nr:flagellar export protein FliJ [Nitrospirota bacterium]